MGECPCDLSQKQVLWPGCRHQSNEILVSLSLNTCKIDEHRGWQTAWEHCRPFSWWELTSVHLSPFCSHPSPLKLTCVVITGLELLSPCVQSWTMDKAEHMCECERRSFNHPYSSTTTTCVGVGEHESGNGGKVQRNVCLLVLYINFRWTILIANVEFKFLNPSIQLSIHQFIHDLYPVISQDHWEARASVSWPKARGGIHPGQVANLPQ